MKLIQPYVYFIRIVADNSTFTDKLAERKKQQFITN